VNDDWQAGRITQQRITPHARQSAQPGLAR
jgi:hypothetical protein